MIKRLLLVLVALGLVFGGIFGWKHRQAEQRAALASAPPPPATIATTKVRTESWQPALHAVGSLVAVQGVEVTNEVAGQVSKLHFESGERVEKGEVLVQLDDSVDQAELEGLIAERKLAEVQIRRTRELLEREMTPPAEYDQAQAQLESAEAGVKSKRAVIRKKKIRAPFSGILGIRRVNLGEYLPAGSSIVPLSTLNPIYVDYSLPERHFAKLAEGQTVEVTVRAYPGRRYTGRITALNPGADPGTRNFRVRAALENPDGHLRPGMFAEVHTLLPVREQVLTLPRTAITYAPYGDSVFVVQDKNGELVVQRRQVETGEVRDGRVEIKQGLERGQQVVSAGQVKLRNGQRVRIDNSVQLDEEIAPS